jgi:hypothetical protein
MATKKLRVTRIQCGENGQTLFVDDSTGIMYNEKGSPVAPDSISNSCQVLPVPPEYIDIEIVDETKQNIRTEVPHSSTEEGGKELSGNIGVTEDQVQPGRVLRDNQEVPGRVVETVQPPNSTISAGTVSTAKSPRPAQGTRTKTR